MHYRVVAPPDERAAKVFAQVREWLAEDREMQRDRQRLTKICCSSQSLIQLQGAPLPQSVSV
jgi:hypothetical protein